MRPRIPLPVELATAPFRVRSGIAAGLGENRLRGPDLARPFHGVRGAGSTAAHSYAPLLRPGDRFSHTTAALIWGLPLPSTPEALHVTATLPYGRPRSAGVRGHTTARNAAVLRDGLPVSDPATLFVELARTLRLDDLVAVGDALVLDPHAMDPRDPRPWIALSELRGSVAASRSPGSAAARRAVRLVREGAESRPETLLRLLLLRAGVPEPELNVDIHDDADRWIGRFDLVFRRQRVIVEYDGDQHRSSTVQYEKDAVRLERAADAGWRLVRVRARGLFTTPDATLARVCAALSRP